jgi:hypothetical protein
MKEGSVPWRNQENESRQDARPREGKQRQQNPASVHSNSSGTGNRDGGEHNRTRTVQIQCKDKINSTLKMQKLIFSLKSSKITTNSRMSPSSFPHLIIGI